MTNVDSYILESLVISESRPAPQLKQAVSQGSAKTSCGKISCYLKCTPVDRACRVVLFCSTSHQESSNAGGTRPFCGKKERKGKFSRIIICLKKWCSHCLVFAGNHSVCRKNILEKDEVSAKHNHSM